MTFKSILMIDIYIKPNKYFYMRVNKYTTNSNQTFE